MIVRMGGGWLARVGIVAVGLAIAVLAFFALAFAVVIGAAVALVLAVRWWWIMRRARKAAEAQRPIEGEYRVVDRDPLDGPR